MPDIKYNTDTWYVKKKSNQEEERLRVVKEAAAIILEDIRSQVYETKHYPPTDNFLRDVKTVVSESLNVFLEKVIVSKKVGSHKK